MKQIHITIIEKIDYSEKKEKKEKVKEPEPIEGEAKEEKPKKRTRKAKKEEITDDEMPELWARTWMRIVKEKNRFFHNLIYLIFFLIIAWSCSICFNHLFRASIS